MAVSFYTKMGYRKRIVMLCWVLFTLPSAFGAERVALVIGISEYINTQALANPRNDARAIAQALQRTGFDVTLKEDLDRYSFEEALYDFGIQAESAELALVFYAGHGLQIDGKNYLMPKDAQLRRLRDLRRMIALDEVIAEAGLAQKLGVVILDACRDNPLAEAFLRERSASTRAVSVGRGLGRVEKPLSNTLVAFATADNATAADGSAEHSPYTTALLEHIERPGLDIRIMFGHVRDSVIKLTEGQQRPYVYGSLGGGQIYLSSALSEDARYALQACRVYLETDQLEQALQCQQRLQKRYPQSSEVQQFVTQAISAYEDKAQQSLDRTQQALQTVTKAVEQTRHYLAELVRLDPDNATVAQIDQRLDDIYAVLGIAGENNNDIAKLQALAAQVATLNKQKQALEQQRNSLRQDRPEIDRALADLKRENRALAGQNSELEGQKQSLQEQLNELLTLPAQVESLDKDKQNLEQYLYSLRQQQSKTDQELVALRQQHETLSAESKTLQQEKNALQARMDQLSKMTDQSSAVTRSGDVLRDTMQGGGEGPLLISVKGECYQMGSPDDAAVKQEDERLHRVCVQDFYIGKNEVTVAEFARFVDATGYITDAERGDGCRVLRDGKWQAVKDYNWTKPGYTQSDQHPVVCISWNDANAYLAWLSEQTRTYYRLPTEAEWEFAARAGSGPSRHWEAVSESCRYANVADKITQQHYQNWTNILDCFDGHVFAAPVGTFKTNAWGLYDTLGNVMEWTCSAYDKAYQGGEQGCAYKADDRVLRGGSWVNRINSLRTAFRNYDEAGNSYFISGFRVAKPVQ